MSAAVPFGDDVLTALEPGGIAEPVTDTLAEPLSTFPAAAPPASKPFRLHPEWAQRGPFW
ncbi:MAG TPA: hypothetical protein VH722_04280 [Alphaproteobacteria bacterium]|jgi:hypothetical protein|nr:hypothetical protein [Alphaproteobacteria bacterium]